MKGRWRLWKHLIMSFLDIYPKKNEVGFDGQRSLLHLASKLTSFGIEAYFIFLR